MGSGPIRRDGCRRPRAACCTNWSRSQPARSPHRSSTPTATRRCTTRPPSPSRCPSRSRSRTARSSTVSGTASNCRPTSAATARSPSLRWAAAELILGANPALFMYSGGPNFAVVVHRNGTPLQQRMAETMIEKQWGSTMVLTEPDAGSDVGAGRTKAILQHDGTWHLEGVKRFITSAEHDVTDEHRPPGARPAGRSRHREPARHQGSEPVRRAEVPSSTRRPASSASATASSSPAWNTRWA